MKKTITAIATAAILTLTACSASAPATSAEQTNTAASSAATAEAAPAPAADGGYAAGYDENGYRTEAPQIGGGESYLTIDDNAARPADRDSLVTLSLKVDTAAYTNVRRYIESGSLPPVDAVRTEELINYFSYDSKMTFDGDSPFALYTEVGPSPFDADKYMSFIRVKTREPDRSSLPPSSLTFLIDTSGSMDSYDKLPLLKEAFSMLVDTLNEGDRVSIVTYAGSSEIVLDGVRGSDKAAILNAIERLSAGGSTAGAQGIQTAYELARKNMLEGGNNRVLLATDGDFNVGLSSTGELERFIAEKRDSGVYLSILGFGSGNIRDDIMETLSKSGNGNYAYIDSVSAAKKTLVDELGANLFTVADDVKAQVEFNPENVRSYRLIGYENRVMPNKDFADDSRDAGEIGAGADVVIMFELELYGDGADNGGLKYSSGRSDSDGSGFGDELFEVRIRYKKPGGRESTQLTRPATVGNIAGRPSADFSFACSVAAFGSLLRGSDYSGGATADDIIEMAKQNLGGDRDGYRLDHLMLLRDYKYLLGR